MNRHAGITRMRTQACCDAHPRMKWPSVSVACVACMIRDRPTSAILAVCANSSQASGGVSAPERCPSAPACLLCQRRPGQVSANKLTCHDLARAPARADAGRVVSRPLPNHAGARTLSLGCTHFATVTRAQPGAAVHGGRPPRMQSATECTQGVGRVPHASPAGAPRAWTGCPGGCLTT